MVMVNGKWWPQKVILVPLASPSGGRRKDWRAQWRQWYISFFTFLLLSFSSFCSFPQLRTQEGQQNIFPFLFFYFFVFLIESTMQAVVFFSCFFLVFSVLKCFSFCFLFPSSPAVRFEKGFQSFLFLWKKNKNLFNWSHQVLSLQTYFSASDIMISSWKPKGQSLTLNPNTNSNAKVKVITKSLMHWWCWCTFNAQAHPRLGERKWRSLDREWQSDTRREARVKESAQRMTLRRNWLAICYYSMKIYKVPMWQVNIGLRLLKK